MENMVILTGLLVSSGSVIRLLLTLTGQLKGPVLYHFLRYGDSERHFFPLPDMLFWVGLLIFFGSLALRRFMQFDYPTELVTLLFLFLAYLSYTYRDWVYDHTNHFPRLPLWTNELYEKTSRHERRRIAFMWLRLPLRTRLLYNANNHAFRLWADMVILATL